MAVPFYEVAERIHLPDEVWNKSDKNNYNP